MNIQSPHLTEAVNLWAGRGITPMPSRDENRVIERFGEKTGAELIAQIHQLETDLYATNVQLIATDIQDMAVKAFEAFKEMHPLVREDIAHTLVWCYTYDFR